MNKKIKNPMSIVANVVLIFLSIAALLPFLLLFLSSITDDLTLIRNGYSFFPSKLSADAYIYLWYKKAIILRGYSITVIITIIGMCIHLSLSSMLGYVLSRKDFPLCRILSFYVFFTMLFSGGMVPTYLMYNFLGIKNTLLALLIPGLLLNGFNVIVMRSYFSSNIPEPIIEAATMDGAGKFKVFLRVVLPMSYPIMATIGLFSGIAYWNDWYNGLIFLTDPKLFSIQNILNRILSEVQFLANADIGSGSVGALTQKIPTVSIRMAIATLAILPILLIYPFFQKYFVKGIALGAVKG